MSFPTINPKIFRKSVLAASTYAGANLITVTGGEGVSLLIENQSSGTVAYRLNGDTEATGTILGNNTKSFGRREISIFSVDFANVASGASTVNVEVTIGVE